jgi:hypothetical protein
MNTVAILEIITLLVDLYYRHAEMEGLTAEEKEKRLREAMLEKRMKKADDLPDV